MQPLIDAFSHKDTLPHIAISVDMLDTGIDLPEVVNLVFFKVVRSKTKFWQMVGRGTRLCPNLFGPGEDKQYFCLFDFCQNLEFFSQNPEYADGPVSEPLSARLFKARLEMISELDKRLAAESKIAEPAKQSDAANLRGELAAFLPQNVAAMNLDNFIVRPQRKSVEKYTKREAWQTLATDDFAELSQNVAGLPTELVDNDEEAKRFDLLVLRTQLAILQAGADYGALHDRIRAIAGALEQQESIPAVKAEMVLIQAAAGEDWWQDVTPPMLENLRKRLRALVKLIEKGKKNIVFADFEDELGTEAAIDLPEVLAGMNMARFRQKARRFLKAHESHLSLQRLRRNQSLTSSAWPSWNACWSRQEGRGS